jgi:hypothetical protein
MRCTRFLVAGVVWGAWPAACTQQRDREDDARTEERLDGPREDLLYRQHRDGYRARAWSSIVRCRHENSMTSGAVGRRSPASRTSTPSGQARESSRSWPRHRCLRLPPPCRSRSCRTRSPRLSARSRPDVLPRDSPGRRAVHRTACFLGSGARLVRWRACRARESHGETCVWPAYGRRIGWKAWRPSFIVAGRRPELRLECCAPFAPAGQSCPDAIPARLIKGDDAWPRQPARGRFGCLS